MERKTILLIAVLCLLSGFIHAQPGIIKGRISNLINNEPIPFANVAIQGTAKGAVSDENGMYVIDGLEPGLYNVQASFIGFKGKTVFEVEVFAKQPTDLDFELEPSATALEAVEITSEAFERPEETPLSLQSIGTNEIQRNPGGNRDISRALQVLPGVSSTVSFRNDIIIRGGAPNENRFFLDGIEVPVINHFATQGSSGGPVGMINVNFIQNVDFYSSAFPANRGNTLSSVLSFEQKDGNPDRLKKNITLGSSDLGVTLDGPLGENTTYIFSARRSYLQFLFSVLGLPFLPTYNDAQFKVKHRFNEKNEITFIGLGAIDDFELNPDAVADAETPEEAREAEYLLGNLPVNEQWNYTVGANYKHYGKNGFQNVVVSRSHLNNSASKYENNDESDPSNLILDYNSEEIENKARLEHTQRFGSWKINVGGSFDDVTYTNSTFNRVASESGIETIDFDSKLNFQRFGLFGQVSKALLKERMTVSFGVRTDWNNFGPSMDNPLEQVSPRLSASYFLTPKLSLSASAGRYYQLPPYTVLGFRNNEGDLVNRENEVTYIQSDHLVAGLRYTFKSNTQISVEGFYKKYDNYPFALRDSINLANLGGDFGVIGSEPVASIGEGRAYGVEFLIQRKLFNDIYGIAALTLVRSEFTDRNQDYVPSSWDNRYILSMTAGKKFKKNWEFGMRLRVLGGTPYTPYDAQTSADKDVWDVNGRGVEYWNLLNTRRLDDSYQLDIRIDKKYFFPKWSLNFYFDVENVTNQQTDLQPYLDVVRDDSGSPITDRDDASKYLLEEIPNTAGTIIPSVGVVVEF